MLIRKINPKLTVSLLGDPHFGKKFVENVPLHRRGEREETQWADLTKSLNVPKGVSIHCCMGDLFDKFYVPNSVVLRAARAWQSAAAKFPKTIFVVIRGNHDASRDTSLVSSYDIFAEILAGTPNIVVTKDVPVEVAGALFVPWSPWKSAEEMLAKTRGKFEFAVGHYDVTDFGDSNPNLIPVKALEKITSKVFTGHVHLANTFKRGKLDVEVTGSMQPYSHGEDPAGDRYITLTLAELEREDYGLLKDKCVRIKARPGEDVPDIDCLQLTVDRRADVNAQEGIDVTLQPFDLKGLWDESFAEAGADDAIRDQAWSKMP